VARNSSVLPVGILCISFYPFKLKILLIVLSRVLVEAVSTLFWLALFLGMTYNYMWNRSTQLFK